MPVKQNSQSISGLVQVPRKTNVRESAEKDSYVVADFLGVFRAEIKSSEKSERMRPMIADRDGTCNSNGCIGEEVCNSDLGCKGSNNGRQNCRSGEKGKKWSNRSSGTSLTEFQAAAASSSSSKKNSGAGEGNKKLCDEGSVSRLTEFQKTSLPLENRIAKVKLICSFGGKILPRPSDGRLRFVGGDTRIIVVNKGIAYAELMHKLTDVYGESLILKYQLPDEDIDALVSLSSDEDLDNMMEEYRRLERSEGSSRPRMFLFSPQDNEIDQFDAIGDMRNSRQLYVDAVNGILNPGVRKKTGSKIKVSLQRSNNKIAQEVTGKLCEAPSTQEERRESLLYVQNIANIVYSSIDMPLSSPQSNSCAPEALPQPLKVIGQSYTTLMPTGRQNDVDYGGIIPSPQSQHGLSYRLSEPQVDLPNKAQPVFFIPPSNIDLLHGHDQHISDAKPLKVGSQGMPILMQEEVGVVGSALDHLLDVQQPYMDSHTLVFQHPPSSACHPPWRHQPDVHQDSHTVTDYTQSAEFEGGHLQNSKPPQYGMDVYPYNVVRGSRDLIDYQQMSHEYADMLPANHRVKHLSTGYEEVVNSESLAQPTSPYRGSSTVQEESTSWKDQQKTRDERSKSNKQLKETQENLGRLQSYVVAHGTPEYLTAEPSILVHFIGKKDGTDGSIGSIQNKIEEGNDVSKHIASMPKMGEIELKDGQISQLLESGMDNSNETHISQIFKSFQETYSKSSDVLGQTGVGGVLANASEVSEHTRQMKEMGVPASCLTQGTEICMPLSNLISLTDVNYEISGDVQPNFMPYTWAGEGGKTKSISLVVALPGHTNDLHMPQTLSSDFSTSGRSQTSRVSESAVYIPSSSKDIPFCSGNNSISFGFQSDGEGTPSTLSTTEDNLDDYFTIELENAVGSIIKFAHRPPSPTLSVNNLAQVNDDVNDENNPNGGVAEEDNLLLEEETEIEDLDQNDPLSDAVIAEAEAIVRGLQTIKNVDLEELRELGSGTFGTVYHGKWRGSDVAIKRIKNCCFLGKPSEQDSLKADFWNEACMLSQLHHPNIVAFYGVVPDGPGGSLGTVTEFMVNGSLKHVLQQNKRSIDHHKRILIASDAACGMEYLHRKNIVHFDLKCDNLLVNMKDPQRPICKVADFGLSKIKHRTLISGGVRGSLPWMAPELLNSGNNMVSEKVDVFSFGMVMWELLTEKEPYADLHCGAIIGGIMNNTLRPPVPKNCEPSWRSLMVRCWSTNPTGRPSFSEIVDEFRSMLTLLYPKGKGHQASSQACP